jgi:hypothetical protein
VSHENVSVVEQGIAAFDSDNVEASLECFAPNVEHISPPGWIEKLAYVGQDGLWELKALWSEQYDGFRVDLEKVFDVSEDRVVALAYFRGRIKGSDVEVEQPFGLDYDMEGGKIRRCRAYFSWNEALEAAGLER